MAVIENRFVCDLSKPVQAQALKGNVFSLDNLGSRLSVLIYDNGQPAAISGSITANCILPDGSTVNVNGGLTTEGDGSKAYVDVPQSCLLIPGILKIAIKCTSSSVITTLAAIVANVYMTKTDNVITPSQQLIDDWNAEISAAIATQNAAIASQDTKISDLKSGLDGIREHTKNLFEPENVLNAYFTASSTYVKSNDSCALVFIPCEGSKTYTVSKTAGTRFAVGYTKAYPVAGSNSSTGTAIYGVTVDNAASSISITTGSDAEYIVAWVFNGGSDTGTRAAMLSSVQIEEGSSATSYEPPYSAIDRILRNVAFTNLGVLDSGTDLNTVKGNTGYYILSVNGSYDNAPVGTSHRRFLFCCPFGSNSALQILFNSTDGIVYQRIYVPSSWSDWKCTVDTESFTELNNSAIKYVSVLESGTDLNDVKSNNGYYVLGVSSSYDNVPVGTDHRRYLICLKYESSSLIQVLLDTTDGVVYQRVYTSSEWSAWKSTKDGTLSNYGTLPNTTPKTDLNTLYGKDGFYTMGVNSEYDHDPVGPQNRRLLVCYTSGGTFTHQILFNSNTGDIYQRVYASGSWSAWKQLSEQTPEICGSFTNRICTSHAGVFTNSKYQNSPKAFKDARKLGIIYQELDVVFTSDLVPVLAHSSFADNAIRIADGDTSQIRFKDYTLAQLKENYVFGDSNYTWTILTLAEGYALLTDLGCVPIIDVGGGSNNPAGSRETLVNYMIANGIECEGLITSERDSFEILCQTGGERYPLGVVIAKSTEDSVTVAENKIADIISAKNTLNLKKAWCFVRRERMETGGDLLSDVSSLLEAGVKIAGYSYDSSTYNTTIPTFFSLVISATVNINYLRYMDTITE